MQKNLWRLTKKQELILKSSIFQKSYKRKFEKLKVYPSFKDKIWCSNLADLQLRIKYNKKFNFYYVVLIF